MQRRRFSLAGVYLSGDKQRVVKYWRPLMRCPPMSAGDTAILLDYMDLLDYFQKNPLTYCYPDMESIRKDHDRLSRKKESIAERLRLEEIRKNEQEKC